MRKGLRRWIILAGLIVSSVWETAAQSEGLLSQYFYLPVYYNAAAAGETHLLNITAAGQITTDNKLSDKIIILTADMPIYFKGIQRAACGLNANYTKTSIGHHVSIAVPLAWRIALGRNNVALGVAPGILNSTIRGYTTQPLTTETSPVTPYHKTSVEIGGGIWYTSSYFRTGISFQHICNKATTDENVIKTPQGTAWYFMAVGNIPIRSSLLDIEPSLIAMLRSGRLKGQATMRAIWKRHFWIGGGYRLHENATVIAGVEIKGFKAGYSLILPYHSGTCRVKCRHEISVGHCFQLDSKQKKPYHKSVRIM